MLGGGHVRSLGQLGESSCVFMSGPGGVVQTAVGQHAMRAFVRGEPAPPRTGEPPEPLSEEEEKAVRQATAELLEQVT
jgi:hypothetical protein